MRRAAAGLAVVLALIACGPASLPATTASPSSRGLPSPTASPSASAAPTETAGASLGAFPALPTAHLPDGAIEALQAVLNRAVDIIDAPGIAAAVIDADRGMWAGAAGTADGTAPLDPAAQFGIGSVTKTIIAAQALLLVEAGDVDLDRPIAEYIGDDLPTNGATVRQVLGMRSGVGDPEVGPDSCRSNLAASISMADLRAVPLGDPLFAPGERFRYTNSNYMLAGILIEDVTGQPLAHVLRSGVLSDPTLERLIYQDAERPTEPVAGPFVILPGSDPVPGPTELLELGGGYLPARCLASAAGPAGGMASDPLTLARWGYLLYGGWVLSDAALAEMTDFQDGYGLAAHDHGASFGVPAVGHEGTVPGYTTQLLAFPDEGLAIAVLINTNGNEGALGSVAGQLRDALTP